MKKLFLLFLSALFLSVSLPVQGAENKAVFSKTEEVAFVNDAGSFSKRWKCRSGKYTVTPDHYESVRKSIHAAGPAFFLLDQPLSAKPGNSVGTVILFRGKGKNLAKAEIGLCTADGTPAVRKSISCYNGEWDQRKLIFDVPDGVKQPLYFFCAVNAGEELSYGSGGASVLSPAEAALYSVKSQKKLWEEAVRGENLALRKKVTFSPKPAYYLTVKGNTDETDLTDGKLGSNPALWFCKEAVAWNTVHGPVSVTIDLGSVQPVDRAVIRICGGRDHSWAVTFPKVFEVWISKDGKNFHRAARLTKLHALEAELSDWKTQYYLPETYDFSGISYPYPFSVPVQADARYVQFRSVVPQVVGMVCDEAAVIKAERKGPFWNRPYQSLPEELEHQSVVIRPMMDTFYIAENLFVPNYLKIDNRKTGNVRNFEYTIDLPKEILYEHDGTSYPADIRTFAGREEKGRRAVFRFRPKYTWKQFSRLAQPYGFGPFYFKLKDGAKIPAEESYAVFSTFADGKPERTRRFPLKTLVIPDASGLKKLDISIWYEDRYVKSRPDLLKVMKRAGVTGIMSFPRMNGVAKDVIDAARKAGFRIRLELEPTNVMNFRKGTEYKCTSAPASARSACPSYRGNFYDESVKQIEAAVRAAAPDAVTFDIEAWEPTNLNRAMDCQRCRAAKEKSGLNWIDFLSKAQADYVKGYSEAVRRAEKTIGKKVRIGYYAVQPFMSYGCREGKVSFLGYPHLYPKYCDEIQNSYYGRETRGAHDQMRKVYLAVGGSSEKFIPWLSAGTGAYYDFPYSGRTGQHVLEMLMNGAGGLQFFARKSFESPLDWYYLAQALSRIAPYEEVILKGKVLTDRKDGALLYSGRQLGKQVLILIGNYGSSREVPLRFSFPKMKTAKDLVTGKTLPVKDHAFSTKIPADEYGLYYLTLGGNFKSLEKGSKSLVRNLNRGVFGGCLAGSHAQTTGSFQNESFFPCFFQSF